MVNWKVCKKNLLYFHPFLTFFFCIVLYFQTISYFTILETWPRSLEPTSVVYDKNSVSSLVENTKSTIQKLEHLLLLKCGSSSSSEKCRDIRKNIENLQSGMTLLSKKVKSMTKVVQSPTFPNNLRKFIGSVGRVNFNYTIQMLEKVRAAAELNFQVYPSLNFVYQVHPRRCSGTTLYLILNGSETLFSSANVAGAPCYCQNLFPFNDFGLYRGERSGGCVHTKKLSFTEPGDKVSLFEVLKRNVTKMNQFMLTPTCPLDNGRPRNFLVQEHLPFPRKVVTTPWEWKKWIFVASIRNPVDRIQSVMNYLNIKTAFGQSCIEDIMQCISLLRDREVAREHLKFELNRNYFVKIFAGVRPFSLPVTREHLDFAKLIAHRFSAIINLERRKQETSKFLTRLKIKTNPKSIKTHAQNAHWKMKRRFVFTNKQREILEKEEKLDMELYNYVVKLQENRQSQQ